MPPPLPSAAGLDERGSCRPYAAPTPCAFECDGPQLHRLDLSLLALSAQPGYLHAVGTDGKSYYFGACGPLQGVTCEGATGEGASVAIQAWSGAPPTIPMGSCAVLGAASPRNCTLEAPTPGDGSTGMGMVCHYAGGSPGLGVTGKNVDVHYVCDSAIPVPHFAAMQVGTVSVWRSMPLESSCATAAAARER